MAAVGQFLSFAEWLDVEISKRGWSQSDCARACELNRAVINKLLNGKCRPQPPTLIAIARGLRIPLETVYRAAGLLPVTGDSDEITEELLYIFKSLQNPQRKSTALRLLRALADEEQNQRRGDSRKAHRSDSPD